MKLQTTTIAIGLSLSLVLIAAPAAQAENPSGKKPAKGRSAMIFKPHIQYPEDAKRARLGGSGVLALTVNSETGTVTAAQMAKSTGHAILDRAAMRAFLRARFTKGAPKRVLVPVDFDPNF